MPGLGGRPLRRKRRAQRRTVSSGYCIAHGRREVGGLFLGVGEGIAERGVVDQELRAVLRRVLEPDQALEAELAGRLPMATKVTQLPKTSWIQRTLDAGVTRRPAWIRRWSALSRGRNISRCSPKRTGWR